MKAISNYVNEQGQLVSVYAYRKPAKASRTWQAVKGSVANMGAKAVGLNARGHNVRSHG